MSSNRQSPNWDKIKDRPPLDNGVYDEWPFSEGFPPSTGGTFEIKTAWGERLAGATIKPGHPSRDAEWDVSQCKVEPKTRTNIFKRKRLPETSVAGWKRLT